MKARLLLLALPALAAAGCSLGGSSEPAASTTVAATTTTTAPPATMALTVYSVDGAVLRPHVVRVPRTRAVATAALHEIVPGASVSVAHGTATVTGDVNADDLPAIVWTLTQFPTVERVDAGGRIGLTRDDFPMSVPPIAVASPASGDSVTSPFHVKGTASVFEATLVVQVLRDGKVIAKQTVTASEGAPARGTFDATVTASPGPATLQLFAPSAADGSPQHEVDVDVTITP